jgi:hypothetical protein
MTFTIVTQKINAFDSEPKELDLFNRPYLSFAETLSVVVEQFGENAEAADLEPVDTGTCLVLHRMGARQAWRVVTPDGPQFVAIVGSAS